MFVLDLFYQCDTLVKQYLHAYSTTYSVLLIKCYISKLLFTLKSVKKKKKKKSCYVILEFAQNVSTVPTQNRSQRSLFEPITNSHASYVRTNQ